ncbi:MAG: hypothetical protein M5U25_10995 [Planctomycetota bacterium]|nr:hypothetical protein [Planctomycetota bacterium]
MTDTLPANGQDLEVNTLLPPNMGVVRIDNELVAYRGTEVRQVQVTNPSTGQTYTINTFWLLDVTRGILGSTVEAHAGGTPIMNMASLRIGRPSGAGSANTSAIQTILGRRPSGPTASSASRRRMVRRRSWVTSVTRSCSSRIPTTRAT